MHPFQAKGEFGMHSAAPSRDGHSPFCEKNRLSAAAPQEPQVEKLHGTLQLMKADQPMHLQQRGQKIFQRYQHRVLQHSLGVTPAPD